MLIAEPYELESVDLKKDFVSLFSNNGEMALEIEYDASIKKDGDGFQSWKNVEVSEIKVKAFNQDGETKDFSFDKSEIMCLIEKYVGESL